MQEERELTSEEKIVSTESTATDQPPEEAEHPVPGIKHEREPDAENIMPVEDGPGTF